MTIEEEIASHLVNSYRFLVSADNFLINCVLESLEDDIIIPSADEYEVIDAIIRRRMVEALTSPFVLIRRRTQYIIRKENIKFD